LVAYIFFVFENSFEKKMPKYVILLFFFKE
jgi:hypothetical protein